MSDYEDEDYYDDEPDSYDSFLEKLLDLLARIGPDYEYDYDDSLVFANPGGNSALRAASASNPRNLPCPTCEAPNRLTPKDQALSYQCDLCADRAERGGDY